MIFMQIMVSIAISAIAYLISPKPKVQTPTAGNLDIPAPKLGEPITVVFGEVWIDDCNISYYGNAQTKAIKASGGK